MAPPESGQQCRPRAEVIEDVQNPPCVMGGAGDDQARKNGQFILKPGRDHPESDQLGRILPSGASAPRGILIHVNELGCRGHPRWREWRFRRRSESLAGLCRFRVVCVFACAAGARNPRLRGRVSRGGDDALNCGGICQLRLPSMWLGFRDRLGCGVAVLGNEGLKPSAVIELIRLLSRTLRRSAGGCFRGYWTAPRELGFLHRPHPSLPQLQTCHPVAMLVPRLRVLRETG